MKANIPLRAVKQHRDIKKHSYILALLKSMREIHSVNVKSLLDCALYARGLKRFFFFFTKHTVKSFVKHAASAEHILDR